MADKLIYLVDTYTKAMDDHEPECLDDTRFAARLSDGYEQLSTLPSKKVKIGSKSVQVTPMVLRIKGEKHALSVGAHHSPVDADAPEGTSSRILTTFTSMVDKLTKSVSTALARTSDDASHLGQLRDHSMPGLSIISGELVSKAYDAGAIARDSGQPLSACPFPKGSAPATKWHQGWHAASKVPPTDSAALDRVRADACALAQSLSGDDEVEVQCPFRPGTDTHHAWVKGFKEGGGKVE